MIKRTAVLHEKYMLSGGLADISSGRLVDGTPVVVRSLQRQHRWKSRVRKRFVSGIKARASLPSHPNVIPSLSYAVGLNPYEILPEIEGCTLLDWRNRNGDLLSKYAPTMLIQIAEALDHVHRNGYLHLDMKPENILVSSVGDHLRCHLTDFDLVLDSSKIWHDKKLRFGTFSYMAPEHLQDGTISLRSDVFSYGVVAYLLCCGHLPFPGNTPSASRESKLSGNFKPEPIGALCKWLPPAVAEFIMRCLSCDPELRPGFIGIAIRDLKKVY